MTRPTRIGVKDWKKHQHYKDDRPPWIKLYGALLDDAAFLALPDVAQLQLIKIWLLASRMGHPLPNDPRLLSGKIGCRGKFHLPVLLDSGFLVYENSRESLEESASEVRPLSTEGREQRTETQGYNQGERRNGNGASVLETGELIAAIQSFATQTVAGRGASIPMTRVEALGPEILRAYKAVGGAKRFLATPPDKLSFLIREFGQALTSARQGQ